MSVTQLVLVNFRFEYTTCDGQQVSIKPNEHYVLVAKTNDHWWYVRKDEVTKPFFIPAKYVTELPPKNTLLGPDGTAQDLLISHYSTHSSSADESLEVTITDIKKDEHGISTCIVPQDIYDSRLAGMEALNKTLPDYELCDLYEDLTKEDISHVGSTISTHLTEETPCAISNAHFPAVNSLNTMTKPVSAEAQTMENSATDLNADIQMLKRAGWDLKILDLKEDGIYKAIDKTNDFAVHETKDSKCTLVEEVAPVCPLSRPIPCSTPSHGSPINSPDAVPEKFLQLSEMVTRRRCMQLNNVLIFARKVVSFQKPFLGIQDDNENLTAVYVNVPRARRSIIESSTSSACSSSWEVSDVPPAPDPPDTLILGSEVWEIHTDQESGLQYYFQPSTGRSTWEYPLQPSMESEAVTEELSPSTSPFHSPACSPAGPSPSRWALDWERVLDKTSGRHYFFNAISGESSWDPPDDLPPPSLSKLHEVAPPPLPEEDYPNEEQVPGSPGLEDTVSSLPFPLTPDYSLAHVNRAVLPRAYLDRSAPAGWTLNIEHDGAWVFTSEHTKEQWIKSLDDLGQTYYYLRDGSKSQWNLPELSSDVGHCQVGNGAMTEQDGLGAMKLWRNSTGYHDEKHSLSHRRNASGSEPSSSPEIQHNALSSMSGMSESEKNLPIQSSESQQQKVSNLEKAGILNKTKISENGKKVRKNWANSWTVLHDGILTFHKDPKSTPAGTSNKTNQIVPEFTVDLKGATVCWAAKEKSSKKNVIELKSRAGIEYLIQYDTDSIINDWHKVIIDTIRQLSLSQDPEHHSEDEEDVSEKFCSADKEDRTNISVDKRRMSNAGRQLSSSSAPEADPKKVRNKLRKFLLKRPTLQSVKEKGYIRENVFGCHLQNLCDQEKTTVPIFVQKCIRTVEKRGLGIDGIYRVSGNLAVIQKLRFRVDHAEDLDLEEGNWDIHVITGALKLFFRELQEPLFPYSHFNSFVQAINLSDYNNRVTYMSDLVKSLPTANHDTMEALFKHLRKVIEHGEENRMTVQNVAIVFGPTLLKPEVESPNLTMYMVFQNQIIEFILNEFETIFHM